MRPRARVQSYSNLDGSRNASIKWYWKWTAVASAFMILGGFLLLPPTFERERPHTTDDHPDPASDLRVAPAVLGIFAVALLASAFSFTGLLCFAVRSPFFQRDLIFLPCLASSVLGLLTVVYNFLVFTRYEFNLPALLTTIGAAVATVVYASLIIFSHRRNPKIRAVPAQLPIPIVSPQHLPRDSESTLWQDASYYENYNRNMFPTAHVPREPPPPTGYDPNSITEDEMQRQQMLMLLLNRDQASTPDPSQSTFRLDWQGQEDEDAPRNGYYAPGSAYPQTAYPGPSPGIVRQMTNELQPWDGVWRTPVSVRSDGRRIPRPSSRDFREARRREIEEGRT